MRESMLSKQTLAFFAALLISLTAHAQTEQMKGYELYSWKIKNHWYYSLLPGTNRSKSYEEITADDVVCRDAAGLKAALQKLPRGEVVVWMSDAPAGAGKSASGQVLNVKHPSRTRIKNIKAICDKLGIRLTLS
jgi:hypothetical protein